MTDRSEEIELKIKQLVPLDHELVGIHVVLTSLNGDLYYKVEFFTKALQIKFMPEWIKVMTSWEHETFKFEYCFLSPKEVKMLLSIRP